MQLLLPALFYVMLIRREEQPKKIAYYFSWGILIVMTPLCLFSVAASYIMD